MVAPIILAWPLISLALVQGLRIPSGEQLVLADAFDSPTRTGILRRFVADRSDDQQVLDIVEDLQVSTLALCSS